VLLLDEPLGALDKKLREQMLLEFRRIHRTLKTTMIYVTHDQEEALVMSDRVAVMNHGRIVRLGPPKELYEDPGHPFVADFLGEANLLPGTTRDAMSVTFCERVIAVSHHVPPGTPVHVVVRPEKFVIGQPPNGWNALTGRVEEVLYLGPITKLQVRTTSGQLLSINQVNRQQVFDCPVGADVCLAWHPDDGHIVVDDRE
jgi:putative spermidine/putrescine transport system ATP-binding protein